ncbi:SGNH/GDSL hydrolase family protein [Anaerocolumna aminovalerica]|uniref:Lysophospholipase L1 n=1 Tax=Anaerocolumna aminovalerica TaxID=1527 RepID=A0A1I5EQI4_9FIRM|nr:SGNH/GDSL hydrolase family protein [Anaerocolumna aminovalerica]SFO13623.1 Lysophospholipase L1 [Anaerocolumna aminovalerica]
MEKDIRDIDKNMSNNGLTATEGIKWFKPYEEPLRLSGFQYFSEDRVYRRLPLSKKVLFERVNNNLNILSEDTAGGQVAFRTNSSRILVRAKNKIGHDMVNMAASGQNGFDLYLGQNGERLKFYGITKFDVKYKEYQCEIIANLPVGQIRDVLLNFPLYDGVEYVEIGVDDGAEVLPPKPFAAPGKIVFYGTSITQGGCATRPGMAYTNILSRWLNREVINLGFSANGLGEYEMAELIADIEDASMVVLDYEANAATTGRLEASLSGFIDIIRKKHPHIPILVLSRIQYLADFYDETLQKRREHYRKFQLDTVEEKRKQGDNNIYFYNGNDLYDDYFDEYTVDFIHPTDLGFWKMAEGLHEVLKKILF